MTSKTVRRVLKAAEVILDGPVQLSIDPGSTTGCEGSRPASAGSTARIAQTYPDHAVIEVTCPCGRTTRIRCDYAAGNPSGAKPEPTQQ